MDQGRRKNGTFDLLAMLPTIGQKHLADFQ